MVWRIKFYHLLIMAWLVVLVGQVPVQAQGGIIYTVTKTADTNDGTCDTDCSFREAISAANAGGTAASIHFSIPGSGTHSIQLNSGLPAISAPVTIDGTSQPSYNGTLLIEINGSNAGIANGLWITGGGATVRGLMVNHFIGQGIILQGGGENVIAGNIIGTNVTYDTGIGNRDGVYIFNSADNTVGGTTLPDRNIIGGNTDDGVNFEGAGAFGNVVVGNVIGTDPSGNVNLGNAGDGVKISNTSSDNVVGGTEPGAGNLIAFNHGRGVYSERDTTFATGNSILGNSMRANNGLGIDLDGENVTANDAGDTDEGANHLQNFPVLTQAETVTGSVSIAGAFNSSSDTDYRIEFFANESCDTSGNGEGERFIGAVDVTTDGTGDASIDATFAVDVEAGEWITATATDADHNTSEFSACVEVEAGTVVVSPPNAAPARNVFTTHTPTLTWTAVSWAASYWVQVDETINFASAIQFQNDQIGAQVLLVQTDVLPSGTYYWHVRAKSAAGVWGSWSVTDSFVIK